MIRILNWNTGGVIFKGNYPSIKEAVEGAVKQGVSLAFADLTGVNLTRVELTGANFAWANLTGANFSGATITGANFYNAILVGADFTGANISDTNLAGVNLTRVNLAWANLTDANFSGATITGANLTGANFAWANLTDANFSGATITRANFYNAILVWANFTGANISDTNLAGADLAWANLTGANFRDSTLSGANFYNAILTNTDFTGANLKDVKYEIILQRKSPEKKTIKYKTIKVIDCDDWDNLVSNTYGKPYILQQQNGCMERQRIAITVPPDCVEDFPNDTLEDSISENGLGVSFKAWLEKDPNEISNISERELFWERKFYPNLSMVINDLYEKGLLEAGEYEIDIDW